MNDSRIAGIYEILCDYLSTERQTLFENVLSKRTRHICAVIEDIYMERNAGAIMRTCDGVGIQDVHVVESYNLLKVAESISQGAQKWLSTSYYSESVECAQALKKQGYRIAATTPHRNGETPDEISLNKPIAVFMGGEKEGLSTALLEEADAFITLPNVGFSESYNVSVAAALVLSRLRERLDAESQFHGLGEIEKARLRIEWGLKSIREGEKVLARHIGDAQVEELKAFLQAN